MAHPKNHRRILGGLFWAFALFQLAGAVFVAVRPPETAAPAAYWALTLGLAAAFALGGYALRRPLPWGRPAGIALSVVALLSFPLGTALGIYGLWALLRERRGLERRDLFTRRRVTR